MDYRVVLIESPEGFSVSCPALPGCHSEGQTRAEAIENIRSAITEWLDAEPTPEQFEQVKQWARTWQATGKALEEIRREELRAIDGKRAIELLCGPADYMTPPRAPKPTSGLVDQQFWFMKVGRRD